jgi:hypothetical protein
VLPGRRRSRYPVDSRELFFAQFQKAGAGVLVDVFSPRRSRDQDS